MRSQFGAVALESRAQPFFSVSTVGLVAFSKHRGDRDMVVRRSTIAPRSLGAHWAFLPTILVLLSVLNVPSSALAGSPPTVRGRSVPFSRYAPAAVKLFVTVRRPGELDAAMHRAHAWRLLAMLAGGSAEGVQSFNLSRALASMLGLQDTAGGRELARSEIGFVAASKSQLEGAVWFVRLPDDAVLAHWFPSKQRAMSGSIGSVRFFQTKTGVMVCERDGVIALAHRWGSGSLLDSAMKLMAERGGEPLERSAVFRELTAYFPPDHLALAYLARDDKAERAETNSVAWWPEIDRALIAVYERGGRLDLAVRASLTTPRHSPKLARAAIERFFRLPQTTLFATATTIDFDKPFNSGRKSPPSSTLEHYLAFLRSLQGAPGEPAANESQIGPHVFLVWGQDFSEGGTTPQLALLVECSNGRVVRGQTRKMVEGILEFIQTIDPAQMGSPLGIVESRHVGAKVSHVAMQAYAETSQLPVVQLLRNTSPAWTVWNGWLILALSRDHIERILDAQYGLVPILATVQDVEVMRRRSTDRSLISIVQPDLATDVLDQWLAAFGTGEPSLLDPVWWRGRGRRGTSAPRTFVNSLQLVEEPAVVVVSLLHPKSAARGRLRPGDRIVGIDGHLLSLSAPKADLQKRWDESKSKPGPSLRVLRDGATIDVLIPRPKVDVLLAGLLVDPADAVRELASLGRTLEFGSFAVDVSDEWHYSARLSLRFRTARVSKASTKEE